MLHTKVGLPFVSRSAMLEGNLAIGGVSVCLSVCLPHAVAPRLWLFINQPSYQVPYFPGEPHLPGLQTKLGRFKQRKRSFWPINYCKAIWCHSRFIQWKQWAYSYNWKTGKKSHRKSHAGFRPVLMTLNGPEQPQGNTVLYSFRSTNFKLGTRMEDDNLHQLQAPWPSRSKVTRSCNQSEPCWPNGPYIEHE